MRVIPTGVPIFWFSLILDSPYENGRIQQAACWAHVRRKFYDLEQAHASPVAREALQRIGAL